jgi:DNA-binding LacI/PurR family transcriptional regulator
VRQDFDEVGRLALKLLINQLADGAADERHVVVEPRLVVRQSCAPPP